MSPPYGIGPLYGGRYPGETTKEYDRRREDELRELARMEATILMVTVCLVTAFATFFAAMLWTWAGWKALSVAAGLGLGWWVCSDWLTDRNMRRRS